MLSLSVTTGYAIKALMCLESGECVPRHISDIAQCTGVPRAYLAKILNALAQQGLVTTKRGYRGGISLARSAEDISLLQIVEAVEGGQWLGECLLGMDDCGVHTNCPVHDFWASFREDITEQLRTTSLASLMASYQCRRAPTKEFSSEDHLCACSQTLPA
ncbi:MAG: Rrf2 family transcriptional regulator [Verrucomicrobia bacterium]|nr:Rrf2 family transcriptional regulator [Verrucomicrobiota bacterium]